MPPTQSSLPYQTAIIAHCYLLYVLSRLRSFFFFFQAEDGIRDLTVTGVQTCALPISSVSATPMMRAISGICGPDSPYGYPRPSMCSWCSSMPGSTSFSCETGRMMLRSEEHTSELQSQSNLVCRLLLEKKKRPRRLKHEQAIEKKPYELEDAKATFH